MSVIKLNSQSIHCLTVELEIIEINDLLFNKTINMKNTRMILGRNVNFIEGKRKIKIF